MVAEVTEMQGVRHFVEAVMALHRDDLTMRQMAVLTHTAEPQTVRGLSQRLGVQKPTVTRATDKLVGLGYVRRRPDPEDRRSVLIERTREGNSFLKLVASRMEQLARAAA